MMHHLSTLDFNWIAILISAVAAFAVGGLWYSPILFGKIWQKELNLSDETLKNSNMVKIFGLTFLLNVFGAIILSAFIGQHPSALHGLFVGATISIAFIATSIGISYLYTRKTFTLYLIDAGYYVTFYCLMGLILGAMN